MRDGDLPRQVGERDEGLRLVNLSPIPPLYSQEVRHPAHNGKTTGSIPVRATGEMMNDTDIEKIYFDASTDRREELIGERRLEDIDYDEWIAVVTAAHRAGLDAVFRAGYAVTRH
jgi:hypothetical protein